MTTLSPARLDLDSPYPLTDEQVAFYREHGYVKLKDVLAPEVLAHYGAEITRLVKELSAGHLPLEQRGTYGQRLARIAARLLGVGGVRVYHDQALYKEPGGGVTPWHADQFFDTPLNPVLWSARS